MRAGREGSSTRREFVRASAALAVGLAGCASPARAPTATAGGSGRFAPAVRERAAAVGREGRRAVVVLQPPDEATSGTGWFLAGEHLVTNRHVVDELDGGSLVGRTIGGTRFDARVRRRAEAPDLALLSAAIDPPAALEPGRSTELQPGQPLVQVGHTRFGYWAVSLGRFVRRVRRGDRTWLLTELPVVRGNSGSPLLTLDGRVVGLTFGTVPRRGTVPNRDPEPAPVTVFETYPRQRVEFGGHVAVETVQRYVDRWTEDADGG